MPCVLYSKCKVEGKLYELSFGYREIRLHGVSVVMHCVWYV